MTIILHYHYLVFSLMGGRILLLCGCCHSGIVNTIECVKRHYGMYPDTIAGGLHMEKAGHERLSRTIEAIQAAGVKKVRAGHCSGGIFVSSLASAGIDAGRITIGRVSYRRPPILMRNPARC
jgi:7,8-dihydropterin-6-yl-methyl-4-(beta-D-ribofuranosyl)aminobenzene 5'-phosphate synthase